MLMSLLKRRLSKMEPFFQSVFGFEEASYNQTKRQLLAMAQFQTRSSPHATYVREECTIQLPSGETLTAGIFSMPSLQELRNEVKSLLSHQSGLERKCSSVKHIFGEARTLHSSDICANGAVIQAASQFNMLEFPSPSTTPEAGISDYIWDRTQGPACAIACAAGTAYRNYLVPVPFGSLTEQTSLQRGQTKKCQLDGLTDMKDYLLEHHALDPWTVKNGYVNSSSDRLQNFKDLLDCNSDEYRDTLAGLLRIGVQDDTLVTDNMSTQVTQVYCSAISIAYTSLSPELWEPIARLVLDATYECTLLVGVLKALASPGQPPPVLLTQVGGGVFGNEEGWISFSIQRAVQKIDEEYGVGLDIRIVHFSGAAS